MCNQEQAPELDVRARMARLLEAEQKIHNKSISREEIQVLTAVTARLDRLLARVAAAEVEDLQSAASRLDQLLKDISDGKDVAAKIRRDKRDRR
jgi:hypothetical protein